MIGSPRSPYGWEISCCMPWLSQSKNARISLKKWVKTGLEFWFSPTQVFRSLSLFETRVRSAGASDNVFFPRSGK